MHNLMITHSFTYSEQSPVDPLDEAKYRPVDRLANQANRATQATTVE